MSIYLYPSSYSLESKERALTNLFKHLSPEWYPQNVISSDIYYFLEMYAEQFSLGATEARSVWKDLFIETARSSTLSERSTSRLYDNFGAPLNIDKNYLQDFEDYNTGSLLQSYRQQLRYIYNNLRFGGTLEGLRGIGKAFFGVGAVSEEEINAIRGWRLFSITGSVIGIDYNNEFIIGNTYIPRLGYKVPVQVNSLVLGQKFTISYSKLGINTWLRRDTTSTVQHLVYNYTATGSISYASASLSKALNEIVPAGMELINMHSNKVQTKRFSSAFESSFMEYAPGDYLRNTRRTSAAGEPVTGAVIFISGEDLGGSFSLGFAAGFDIVNPDSSGSATPRIVDFDPNNVDWMYDWVIMTRNESYVDVEMRTYMSQSIPNTVYFQPLKRDGADIMSFASGARGGHWICNNGMYFDEISGNSINSRLYRQDSLSTAAPRIVSARYFQGLGVLANEDRMFFSGSITSSGSMPLDGNWFAEMWIYGINQNSAEDLNHISFTLQENETVLDVGTGGGFSLGFDTGFAVTTVSSSIIPSIVGDTNPGIKFGINGVDKTAFLWLNDGTEKIVTASIASYFFEEGVRPHYLACTYYSGSVYLYIDGNVLGGGAFEIAADLTNDYARYVNLQVSGYGVGVDEFKIEEGVLTPDQARANFIAGKSGVSSFIIPSGSVGRGYSQLQFVVHASGSNEVELHQYSIKGVPGGIQDIRERNITKDIIRVPVFFSNV